MELIVQRQLEDINCGNGVYLEVFLKATTRAGLEVRVVFAPWRSFGNRPWATVHPRFLSLIKEITWPRSIRFGGYFCSLSPTVWMRFFIRIGKELLRRSGFGIPIYSYLGDPLSTHEAEIVAAVCNQATATLTVAEYSALGPVLKMLGTPALKGVLMHDLFSDRGARFRQSLLAPDFLEITREQEADWVSAADFCVFASSDEMAGFSSLIPNAVCVWLPPQLPKFAVNSEDTKPRVVFVGTRHAGNEDALRHFVDAIWPDIVKRRPDTEFWVVGSIGGSLDSGIKKYPGIKLMGRIGDLGEIGGQNSVGVAPTRLATGVSIKVAEYLLLKMPCVAYPLALEGFGRVLDELVDIAVDPADFASRVVRLLDDPEARRRRSKMAESQTSDRLADDAVVAYLQTVGATNG